MTTTDLVVLNDGTNREDWLASRLPFITATQAAAIAGSHPYYKLIDVWNEKTDPDHDPDAMRNKWLEERAANGTKHEPEIIEWVSSLDITGGPGAPFAEDGRLLTQQHLLDEFPLLPPASTPDGSKIVGSALVLVEGKTTEQDWENDGLPQHIYDQCLWQLYTTGAVTVWVGQWRFKWSGKGDARKAELMGKNILKVQMDERRLAFLQERVAEFRRMIQEGIAPESDLELVREIDPFDATPEELAEWEQDQELDDLLTELDEIEARMSDDAKRATEIKAKAAPMVKAYEGRRVHLIGTRRIIKLVRFWKASEDTSQLPAATRREITTWIESSRVTYDKNPEYRAPEDQQ